MYIQDMFNLMWGQNVSQLPWPLFANTIQSYFLKATRQDLDAPVRPLSPHDMHYIHINFFASRTHVDHKSYQRFWEWFGKVLQKLRYQRHWVTLWNLGLIYGFISREAVLAQLAARPVGSFLLRFSETSAGSISIGFKSADMDKSVKNYLVKEDDVTGVRKSLADFIWYASQPIPHINQSNQIKSNPIKSNQIQSNSIQSTNCLINRPKYDSVLLRWKLFGWC